MTDWIAYRFDGVDWLIASGAVEPWKNDKETRASLFAFSPVVLLVAVDAVARSEAASGYPQDATAPSTAPSTAPLRHPDVPPRRAGAVDEGPPAARGVHGRGATTAGVVVRVAIGARVLERTGVGGGDGIAAASVDVFFTTDEPEMVPRRTRRCARSAR